MAAWEAVAFDLDGVLWDSTGAHAAAYAFVLRPFALPGFAYEEVAGMRTSEAFRGLAARYRLSWTEDDIVRLTAEKQRHAYETLADCPPVIDGAVAAITHLAATVPLALTTGSRRVCAELFIASGGLQEHFQVVVTGDEVTRGKPDPEAYLRTCEALAASPGATLAVEDSVSGVKAARAAGMDVVGVLGTSSGQALQAAGARCVFPNLKEIEAWIIAAS